MDQQVYTPVKCFGWWTDQRKVYDTNFLELIKKPQVWWVADGKSWRSTSHEGFFIDFPAFNDWQRRCPEERPWPKIPCFWYCLDREESLGEKQHYGWVLSYDTYIAYGETVYCFGDDPRHDKGLVEFWRAFRGRRPL